MKNSILFLFCLPMFLLTSCNKENTDFDNSNVEIELREGDLSDKNGCFAIVYPVKIEFPDGTIVTIESEDEFVPDIKSWYENNPDSKERPGLVYPIQITFEGDKSKVISSEEQMMRVKKYCKEKRGKTRIDCFKIIYPVTYIMPDGSEVSGSSALEIKQSIKDWYAVNTQFDQRPALSYPVDVRVVGHGVISIANEEEMVALKKKCERKAIDKRDCFKLDFPVSFTMPDGSELTVNNEDEMNSSLKDWYTAHQDSDIKPSLNYPIVIIFRDGHSYTVNSEKEMIEVKKKCSDR